MVVFAERLKEIRTTKNFTQEKVAKDLGLPPAKISQWETGYIEPSLEWLIKLCDYFDVPADYILGRTDY